MVDALASSDIHDASHHVLGAVVDGVFCSRRGGDAGLVVRADGADHRGPSQPGFLNSVVAHGPGAAWHQHDLAAQRPVGEQAPVGGHRRHAQAGSLGKADGVRHSYHVPGRLYRVLRSRTEGAPELGFEEPYSFAHPRLEHSWPHAIDDTRAVLVGNNPRKSDAGGQPGPTFPVGRVYSGRDDPDSHFAGARLRVSHFPELHDFGRPVLFKPYRFHSSFRFDGLNSLLTVKRDLVRNGAYS